MQQYAKIPKASTIYLHRLNGRSASLTAFGLQRSVLSSFHCSRRLRGASSSWNCSKGRRDALVCFNHPPSVSESRSIIMRFLRSTLSLQVTPSAAACEPLESRQCGPSSLLKRHLARLALAAALLVVILFIPAQALAKSCCEGSAMQGSSITRAFKGAGSQALLGSLRLSPCIIPRGCAWSNISGKSSLAVSPQACWTSPCTLTST